MEVDKGEDDDEKEDEKEVNAKDKAEETIHILQERIHLEALRKEVWPEPVHRGLVGLVNRASGFESKGYGFDFRRLRGELYSLETAHFVLEIRWCPRALTY